MSDIVHSRQDARIAALPALYKTQHERLACELALKLDDSAVIFQRHGYDADQALALLETKEFSITLDRVAREMQASGVTFRAKARAMAEDLLPHAYEIATDDLASPAVRADIIQWMARVADLEPAPKPKDGVPTGGSGLHLSITFAGEAPMKVIGSEPLTLEHA